MDNKNRDGNDAKQDSWGEAEKRHLAENKWREQVREAERKQERENRVEEKQKPTNPERTGTRETETDVPENTYIVDKQSLSKRETQGNATKETFEDPVEKAVREWEDPHDPGHKEMERRESVAQKEFDNEARRHFGHLSGTVEHQAWTEKRRQEELAKGRIEGSDFGVNATMWHPDGKPVYLDYVDYKKDVIVDLKPLASDKSEEKLTKRYEEQRERHIAAYEHTTGRKVFSYDYALYPSSKDIYKEGNES